MPTSRSGGTRNATRADVWLHARHLRFAGRSEHLHFLDADTAHDHVAFLIGPRPANERVVRNLRLERRAARLHRDFRPLVLAFRAELAFRRSFQIAFNLDAVPDSPLPLSQ